MPIHCDFINPKCFDYVSETSDIQGSHRKSFTAKLLQFQRTRIEIRILVVCTIQFHSFRSDQHSVLLEPEYNEYRHRNSKPCLASSKPRPCSAPPSRYRQKRMVDLYFINSDHWLDPPYHMVLQRQPNGNQRIWSGS